MSRTEHSIRMEMREAAANAKAGFWRSALIAAFVVFLFTLAAGAQTASTFDTGTVTGTITDPSGAVIPHATVVITNTGTARETAVKTGDDGIFSTPGADCRSAIMLSPFQRASSARPPPSRSC